MLNITYIHETILSNAKIIREENCEEGLNMIDLYENNLYSAFSEYELSGYIEKSSYIYKLDIHDIISTNNRLADTIPIKKINVPKNTFIEDSETDLLCECGGELCLSESTYSLECGQCGATIRYNGLTGSRLLKSDGRIVNLSNNYKHRNYCLQIYRNIFALEKYVFIADEDDENVFNKIKFNTTKYINKNRIQPMLLSCNVLKRMVSSAHKKKWLPHINLLKKEITGYHPPRLTNEEESLFYIYYNIYQDTYSKCYKKSDEKVSYMRCEYVIYKILEQMLPDSGKKISILSHITLPRYDTLEKLDLKYKKICDSSNGCLHYSSTLKGRC